jgi:hypothetical protein
MRKVRVRRRVNLRLLTVFGHIGDDCRDAKHQGCARCVRRSARARACGRATADEAAVTFDHISGGWWDARTVVRGEGG